MSALDEKLRKFEDGLAYTQECMCVAGTAIAVEWAYLYGTKKDLERALLLLTAGIDRMEMSRPEKSSLRKKFVSDKRAADRKKSR